MKIPKSIKLGRLTVEVVEVENVVKAAKEIKLWGADGLKGECLGLADLAGGRILLEKALAPGTKEVIFRHELAHLIASLLEVRVNEGQVNYLGDLLADVAAILK